MSTEDLALRVAALKVVADTARDAYNQARADAAAVMQRGDRLMGRSPLDGAKIGAVTKTDPKPVCRITDESALTDWVVEHYPNHVEFDFDVIGSDQEVKSVLFEHAPHLLRRTRTISPDLLRQLREDSTALGAPVGPGGEADVPGLVVEIPEGTVSCRPDPDAFAVVVELVRSERLSFESLVHPTLPGGER